MWLTGKKSPKKTKKQKKHANNIKSINKLKSEEYLKLSERYNWNVFHTHKFSYRGD